MDLQVGQSCQHAYDRGQFKQAVEGDRGGDGRQEQEDGDQGAGFESVLPGVAVRSFLAQRHGHDGSRYAPVDQGRDKQFEKCPEIDQAFRCTYTLLPDHQGRDVAKRAERASGIGGDHDIDAGDHDEFAIVSGHGHDHCAHQQGGGQVVGDRRDEERQQAGDPEQGAQAEVLLDQPGAQGREHIQFVHGVDIGHGHQQEQHEFGVFQQIVADRLLDLLAHTVFVVFHCDQRPDDAGRENDRFGLAQVGEFLGHHQRVGHYEEPQGEKAHP